MKPTLLVLAAGMGSRYGGMKQLDAVGPDGEVLLDYSVFDAASAGFGKVVFVIRRDFEAEFRERCGKRFEKKIAVDYAFQQLDNLPAGFSPSPDRQKPWGTAHAILCAKSAVDTPFAAINADDFYGRESYETMARFLEASHAQFAIAGYRLNRTLSEHGTVSRGVCQVDEQQLLTKIQEFTAIERRGSAARQIMPDGSIVEFTGNEPVSMNFWGFTPDLFDHLEALFVEFLRQHGGAPKSEFYIPTAVAQMTERGQATVKVLQSNANWFGVTYQEDRPGVVAALASLARDGSYPSPLWP